MPLHLFANVLTLCKKDFRLNCIAWYMNPRVLVIFALKLSGWASCVQGLSLPVKQEDKEILDLVIKKAEALQHHITDILGLVLPIQVFCWSPMYFIAL